MLVELWVGEVVDPDHVIRVRRDIRGRDYRFDVPSPRVVVTLAGGSEIVYLCDSIEEMICLHENTVRRIEEARFNRAPITS